MKKSGFYLKGIIALLAAVMVIGFSGCPMDGGTEPATREQYTDDAVLLNEKAKYETGFALGLSETDIGTDITSRVIQLKEGKRADTSIQVSVVDVDGSGFFSLNENGALTLAAMPSGSVQKDEVGEPDPEKTEAEIEARTEIAPDTGVVTLQFKKGDSVSTLDIIIAIVAPGTEGARIAVKDGETYLLYGYDVINSSYINGSDVKITRPILDINKVNAADLVSHRDETASKWESATGETITEMNESLNVSANAGYKAAMFSVKVEANFTTGSSSKQTRRFATGRGIQYVKEEWLKNTRPEILAKMVDQYFEADVKTLDADTIIKTYGTHLLGRVYWGGNAEFFYSYSGTEYSTNQSLKVAVDAAYGAGTGGAASTWQQAKTELSNNASFKSETRGGSNTAFTNLDQFAIGYADWVQSVRNQPTLAGVPNLNQDLIPIWEIARYIDPGKAEAIFNRFEQIVSKRGTNLQGFKYVEIPAYVTALDAYKSSGTGVPSGYTHVVRTDMYNPNGGEVLDTNRGNAGSTIRIAYKSEAILNNNDVIADIMILSGKNASAPAGWQKIGLDLNSGAGAWSEYLYLAYRKANSNDTQAISFIGSYCESSGGSGQILSGYSWVSGRKDLNSKAAGRYIYLTVQKKPFTWKTN